MKISYKCEDVPYIVCYTFSKSEDMLLHNDQNWEINFDTTLLYKSTNFNTVSSVVPEVSLLAIKKNVVEDHIMHLVVAAHCSLELWA